MLVMVLTASADRAAAEVEGAARVIDGDTLEIGGERVRLQGIDAPESRQLCERGGAAYACGDMATQWLVERIEGLTVRCTGDRRDRYDRLLAVCRSGGTDLAEALVRAGWAVAYLRYSQAYLGAEEAARYRRAGMWAGRFTRPAAWRRLRGRPTVVGLSASCLVKGNVNRNGERIFHRPGGQAYDRVRIRPHEGDRCFSSEQEALASGFRPSRR